MLIFQYLAIVLCHFVALLGDVRHFSVAFLPFRRTSPARRQKHSHSVDVVGQIAQAYLHSRSAYANSTQQQIPRLLRLHAKDMLNPGTNLCPGFVSFLLSLRQFTVTASFALDMFSKAIAGQIFQVDRRPIGRIRPYILARIPGKDLRKHLAVMLGSIRDRIATDQFEFHINRDVILVSVIGLAVLLGPPGIDVFSSAFVFRPVLGDLSLFYLSILFSAVPLLGYVDYAGIHYLPFHGRKTVGTEVGVEGCKEILDNPCLAQVFSEAPDGRGVRDLAADVQPEKTPEGMPVKYLKLGRVVRQIVQRLQDEDFEQQDDIIPLRANIGLTILVPRLFERWPENIPVNRRVDLGKWVAVLVHLVKPVLEIEKSCLNHAGLHRTCCLSC
jgi:hypothetical protein